MNLSESIIIHVVDDKATVTIANRIERNRIAPRFALESYYKTFPTVLHTRTSNMYAPM